jgi:hypothetical protein
LSTLKQKNPVSKELLDRVNNIPGLNYGLPEEDKKHLDAIGILSLPSHLRKTAVAIHRKDRVSAKEISVITGVDEGIERVNLEELTELKYLLAVQEGKSKFYYL